jgi:hypothetical protein
MPTATGGGSGRVNGGTSPTIPVGDLAIGMEANNKPGSANKDTTSYPVANQNMT